MDNTPYSVLELDSPTLVPCNSPALTPAQSLNQMPMESSPPPSSAGISDCLSPELSFFNMSLVSDTSEDDDEFHLPAPLDLNDNDTDDDLFYAPLEAPRRTSAIGAERGLGLGIAGLARKDGSSPFDGLGLLALRPTAWRTHTMEEDHDFDDADGALSATFRAETLRTFNDDPCHAHTLGVIPECSEWYAAQRCDNDTETEPRQGERASADEAAAATCYEHEHDRRSQRGTRLSRGFSAETISSAMKRSASGWAGGAYADGERGVRRARAATWPTGAGGSPSQNLPSGRDVQRVWRV
ncbi:hypothetical protein HYPSUDRAFT_219669 [Hypholoma sublateritium FD-334 SS-4]|uniref:Uncharacterized protein n=1 Tax=Hypholoma sublateritium (strain FD-334 SS-4) TaxID=945553 RepID=A0A0D2NAE0_HYPSF|nr:hypothetical protein HYPSUDRAFT_219669 [Hypholoma sublateritium FD-334 SS-4]